MISSPGSPDPSSMLEGVAQMMASTPYISWLGVAFDHVAADDVVLRVPFRAELTNDGANYHGGVIAAALDTAGAAAAWSCRDPAAGVRASTVSMSVQYVGPCAGVDLVCRATTVRRGRQLIFTEIHATRGSVDGAAVAHAVQTYRIV